MKREEAIKYLCLDIKKIVCEDCYPEKETDCAECEYKIAIDIAIEALKEQRPHGEWITTSNIWADDDLAAWGHYKKCSCCHNQEKWRTPFCPNCGADMRQKEESEE